MTAEPNTIKAIRWQETIAIVELTGDIDMHRTPTVHRGIIAVCNRRPSQLLIDLQEVPYIDSSGIGMLVEIFRRMKASGGSLRLCGLSERVVGVFEITKLDKFFNIFPGQTEALAG